MASVLPTTEYQLQSHCSRHTALLAQGQQQQPILIVLGPLPPGSPAPYHGRAVVIVFVIWLPGLEAAPAESMVTFGTGHAMEEASLSEGVCLWAGVCQDCQVPGHTTDNALGLWPVPLPCSYLHLTKDLLNAPLLLNLPIV